MVLFKSILSAEETHSLIKRYLRSDDFQILGCTESKTEDDRGKNISLCFKVLFEGTKLAVKFKVEEALRYQEIFNHPTFYSNFSSKYYFAKNHLIVEDLQEQGFISTKEYDLQHVKISLKTLAKYHAGSISLEEEESKKLGKRFKFIEKYPELMINDVKLVERLTNIDILIEVFEPNFGSVQFKEHLTNLTQKLKDKNWENFRTVLCHGSLWGQSVLFKYKDGIPIDCKIVNFESQHYNSPAFDVLQLIYMNTSQEFRKHHLHDLLKFYHESLGKQLLGNDIKVNNVLPLLEDFELAVHQALLYIKLQKPYLYLKTYINANIESVKSHLNENKEIKAAIEECLSELEDFVTHPCITLEDCFRIINNKLNTSDYELISHKMIPLGDISGFIGDHNKLIIEVLVHGKKQTLNLFAKCMPQNSAGVALATDSHSYIKEVVLYKQYFPMLRNLGLNIINDFTVPCYFTRWNEVLVFDDMAMLSFATLNSRESYNYETVKMIIKNIAKLHACSLIAEDKLEKQTQAAYHLNEHFFMKEGLYALEEGHGSRNWALTGIKALDFTLGLFPNPNASVSDDELKPTMLKAFNNVFKLVQSSDKFRNVVCHGDLWTSNILIQTIGGKQVDCRFIDWQISRYCPPAHDLLNFLYLTTNRDLRRHHFNSIIDFYHNELGTNLKKYGYNIDELYPHEIFWKSVEHLIPQAVCQQVLYSHLIYLTSDIIKECMVDDDAWKTAFTKDRRDLIAFASKKDPIYAGCLSEALQDLREMCVKYADMI